MTQITIIDTGSRRVDATADPDRGTFLVDAGAAARRPWGGS